MKSKLILCAILFFSVFMFNACKKNSTGPNTGTVSGNFFPNSDGTTYKYSIQKTDSSGATYSGTRTTNYSGTETINGTVYQKEIDSLNIYGAQSTFISYFNKSNNEVDIHIDTTGLSTSIPAAYLPYVSLDSKIVAYKFPFSDGSNWSVFNMYLTMQNIKITIVSVSAKYMGTEPVTLSLNSGTVTKDAAKVQYDLKLITNPLAPQNASNYTADVWLVDNIGLVKAQGNGTILSVFTGGGINMADTSSVVSQSLVSYSIK